MPSGAKSDAAPTVTVGSSAPPAPPPEVQELVALRQRRHPWVVLTSVVLIVVIVAAGTSFLVTGGRLQSTNDAYVEGRVVQISPKVSGQVILLRVDDNDAVKAGDVLLQIDPVDYQAKVDQAVAAVRAAESAVDQAKAAVLRAEANVGEAQASARAAASEATRRSSDYRRYAAMGTDGVSAQQLENAKQASEAANDEKDAAEKKSAAAAAELNVARTNVASTQAQVAAAEAQLRFAQLQLQYTKVYAPESGNVTRKNVESGAFVATGQPLMAIVPSERWVIANFKEVQLDRMRVGQAVQVTVDSFPDMPLRGHVQSLQAGTGSRFQLLPPENATGNWVKVVQRLPVKIVFEPNQPGVERLAQGMSVEVTVDTRNRSGVVAEAR
ncbi:MAG TPA: HlyD family secretion protein [Tepidisphaeraceae bacterium]|nr:HlyD family secretion protein [Tepidisphaeraceae bacterium]